MLRREGIYSSHLATWRKQRQHAADGGALDRKRGPKVDPVAVQARRVLELENEVERLSKEVLRLEDETVFLHRLLESKPSPKGQLPPASDAS